ncbi:MAG: glycoside hydrolase family 20 zincin-like fold domain-containing protein, partial [Anaerolineae bacterium]
MPQPQRLARLPGMFKASPEHVLHVREGNAQGSAVKAIRRALGGEVPLATRDLPADLFAWYARPGDAVPAPASPKGLEAYALRIDEQSIAISAQAETGAFYAGQTLRQLADPAGFPCVEIADWPDLALRGIHLDLKGCMPTFEYLLDWIETLASLKVNCLLVEYEDKFPYTSHPAVVSPQALTHEQLQRLLAVAGDNFIEVVPLLQCFGHVEFILKHEQYTPLREAGHIFQFCPLVPGSLEVFKEMAREVIEAHTGSRYFHLGADETWALGECPRCRDFAARKSKFALYVNYIREACHFVSGLGKRPIIWDDMVWREDRPELVRQIPEDVILCDWFYHIYDRRVRTFPYADQMWLSRQWLEQDPTLRPWHARPVEELPAEGVAFARRYWDKGEWPLWGEALPYVDYFKELGRDVIGASAAKGATHYWSYIPGHNDRYRNVAFWAQAAREKGIMGVFNTAWSRYNGVLPPCEPLELCWYPIAAAAELDWHADTSREEFERKFGQRFLGSAEATRVIRHLDAGGAALDAEELDRLLKAGGRATYAQHLATARTLKQIWRDAEAALDWLRPRLYQSAAGTLAEEDKARMHQGLESLLERIQAWRTEAEAVLRQGLLAAE